MNSNNQTGFSTVASLIGLCVLGLGFLIMILMAFYTIDEGEVGIIKKWGSATSQESPGLHFKMPIRDTVEVIDVRARKSAEDMQAATSEQMPANVSVSFNWAVSEGSAMDLFKKYGGLPQFEDRILDPMMRSVAKGAISQFTAEQLIQNRAGVVTEIEAGMEKKIARYTGVTMDSVQLENIQLPPAYLESIQLKQQAKNQADQAVEDLRKQETQSRALVNTANSERDAAKSIADGKAYATEVQAKAEAAAIRLRGLAEAEALEAQAKSLESSPVLVEYERAKRWDGGMPTTMMGGGEAVMWSMGPPNK